MMNPAFKELPDPMLNRLLQVVKAALTLHQLVGAWKRAGVVTIPKRARDTNP